MKETHLASLELRRIAESLWEYFPIPGAREAKAFIPRVLREEEAQLVPELKFVIRILRCLLRQETPTQKDLGAFCRALNEEVRVSAHTSPFTHLRVGTRSGRLSARYPAELLVRFAEKLREHPELMMSSPIAICGFCAGIFLRKRIKHSDQTFCSDPCRFKRWSQKRSKADPSYFARKARDNRASKRAQRKGKEAATVKGRAVGKRRVLRAPKGPD